MVEVVVEVVLLSSSSLLLLPLHPSPPLTATKREA